MFLCVLLFGCNDDRSSEKEVATSSVDIEVRRIPELGPVLSENVRELALAYIELIDKDFAEVDDSVLAFQSVIEKFLAQPDTESMYAARSGWLNAIGSYERTALHRYFASLILPQSQSLALFKLQYQINQWPILPGYIDYVDGYPDSGVVHDTTVALTIDSLREQHGAFDLSEATLGFHVIEFLLWGLNQDDVSPREATDFVSTAQLTAAQSDSGMLPEQLPENRRRQLLSLVTEALALDIRGMQTLWDENSASFRNNLTATDSNRLLSYLTDAMADMLTEELLIRSLYPALNSNFSESIQSPFSHSTQNAVSAQLSGIESLLLESFTRDGDTLDSILSSLSADFADFFYQNFDSSKECLVLLYSDLRPPETPTEAMQTEFDIVECINLVTNMIDHLQRIKISLI